MGKLAKELLKQAIKSGRRRSDADNKKVTEMCNVFERVLHQLGLHVVEREHIQTWHVQEFFDYRLTVDEISDATAMNNAAVLRRALPKAAIPSNSELGINPRDRSGTHCPKTTAEVLSAFDATPTWRTQDEGFRLVAELQGALGLRALEAIKCVRCLRDWEHALRYGATALHLTREAGPKGGLPRNISIFADERADLLNLVQRARAFARQYRTGPEAPPGQRRPHGMLIVSNSLEHARNLYGDAWRDAGLVRAEASHSLRYGAAQRLLARFSAEGLPRADCLVRIASELGHGDTRGKWINQVYLKNGPVPETLCA